MPTNHSETREEETNGTGGHAQLQSPPVQPRVEYLFNVKIPDGCLDPDGGDCPHKIKEVKTHYNPV